MPQVCKGSGIRKLGKIILMKQKLFERCARHMIGSSVSYGCIAAVCVAYSAIWLLHCLKALLLVTALVRREFEC